MSHQSGITGSEPLQEALGELRSAAGLRVLKVSIEEEELVPGGSAHAEGTWEEDWDKVVLPLLEDRQPCYLLYRLDTQNSSGYDYVFLIYSPDFAHIRQKMLYASTRATMKNLVGLNFIKDELFGTVPDDVSLEGYEKHRVAADAPAPLTDAEIEKAEIRAAETGVEIGASTKRAIATGIQFPMSDEAHAKVEAWNSGSITYVQLCLDLEGETVEVAQAENLDIDAISGTIPDDSARYSLFTFKHNHEGDHQEAKIFVYSCPGYKCSVKERMLYSSAKGPLIDDICADFNIVFDKKLEIGEAAEFTQEWLYDQLHPAKTVFKQKFARPSRPGKGGRRLMRSSKSD